MADELAQLALAATDGEWSDDAARPSSQGPLHGTATEYPVPVDAQVGRDPLGRLMTTGRKV